MNRLVSIVYPESVATTYEYGKDTADGGRANRIAKVSDESGSVEYRYGALGETVEERRSITRLDSNQSGAAVRRMGYRSNYLGQLETVTFDDGEVVTYRYNRGGQVKTVTGTKEHGNGVYPYVKDAGYDEFGQRVSIKYGNDVETRYRYDPERRWLSGIETKNRRGQSYQDIAYTLDAVGNVKTYKNEGGGFTTKQEYRYDDLYQLVEVTGNSRGSGELGLSYYESKYRQEYRFNGIGNMTVKVSEERHPGAKAPGDQLNYALDYDYIQGTHKASRIGNRYYGYDRNGNVTAEQDGTPVTAGTGTGNATVREEGGGVYSTDYGFALRNKQQGETATGGINRREYEWNERNLLKRSADGQWDVQYRYGADGQRALKYSASGALREETLYFNKMFQITKVGSVPSTESKHIYVGEVRIATKQKREGNVNLEQEGRQQYYYHGDHLGSAQLVTDWKGDLYEHLEYAPYGELWIDRAAMDVGQNATPFRFTGKELDKETGLYYYGARYLDPKTSRWISGDPAMGEYVPQAPVNDEAKKYNKNLPGMGGVFNTVNLHVYHYAGNNPIKLSDPDGRSDRTYKFILIEFHNSSSSSWVSYSSKHYFSEKKTRHGSKLELAPNMNITIFANNGKGYVAYTNNSNKNVTIDLERIIDHYDNFLEGIEKKVDEILKEYRTIYSEFIKNSDDVIQKYYESFLQIAAGYDPVDVIAGSGVLSEFLESFKGSIDNMVDMSNLKSRIKQLTDEYNGGYVKIIE